MTEENDEETFDPETWPRAELVGGPMDGHEIFAPMPEYRVPLAWPLKDSGGFPGVFVDESEIRLYWYVPMTVTNLLRKISTFYYAYAGTSTLNEPEPDVGALYDRSTTAHPAFPENEE
jgi:hypothetical protein